VVPEEVQKAPKETGNSVPKVSVSQCSTVKMDEAILSRKHVWAFRGCQPLEINWTGHWQRDCQTELLRAFITRVQRVFGGAQLEIFTKVGRWLVILVENLPFCILDCYSKLFRIAEIPQTLPTQSWFWFAESSWPGSKNTKMELVESAWPGAESEWMWVKWWQLRFLQCHLMTVQSSKEFGSRSR